MKTFNDLEAPKNKRKLLFLFSSFNVFKKVGLGVETWVFWQGGGCGWAWAGVCR